MKRIFFSAFLSIVILSACSQKIEKNSDNETQFKDFNLVRIDSIKIPYLGNPILQDISPLNHKILFIESGPTDEEIFITDFNGKILNSFVTNGNTIVGHLRRIAPLYFEEDGNSFLSFGQPHVKRVSIDGTNVEIIFTGIPLYYSGFPSPTNEIIFKGNKIFFNNRSEISEYNRYQKEYLKSLKLLGNFDLEKNEITYFLPFPESSKYHNGLIYPHSNWVSRFIFSKNELIVAFEGEPALFVFEDKEPFSFIKKIDLKLDNFNAYKGHPEGEKGIDFMDAMTTLGKIESIKKVGEYVLVGYNPGFNNEQIRNWKNTISPEEKRELINKFKKETPSKILVLNENLELLGDFSFPDNILISSLMERDGYLWGSKYNPDTEEDYLTIYKLEFSEK
jgi:hypothetical protein